MTRFKAQVTSQKSQGTNTIVGMPFVTCDLCLVTWSVRYNSRLAAVAASPAISSHKAATPKPPPSTF